MITELKDKTWYSFVSEESFKDWKFSIERSTGEFDMETFTTELKSGRVFIESWFNGSGYGKDGHEMILEEEYHLFEEVLNEEENIHNMSKLLGRG